MGEIHDALDQITGSLPYKAWAVSSPVDAGKVTSELAGVRKPLPGSAFARGLVRLARLDPPGPPPIPPSALDPLWQRDLVFTRTLSNFSGIQREAARAAGFSVLLVQLDYTEYAGPNRDELATIGPGLRNAGWKIAGWATAGYLSDPRADGVRHASLVRELSLDGWVANMETWAEGPEAWKCAAFLEGWRLGAGRGPLAVSCMSSDNPNWARPFDYPSWLAVPGAAVMPQVYGASYPGYTVANCLATMARGNVPGDRLALTFNVVDGTGPFADYQTWKGPRSIYTGDDSNVATWEALKR
jgi:hypothetical protein